MAFDLPVPSIRSGEFLGNPADTPSGSRRKLAGFSLIELLAVIAMLALLTGFTTLAIQSTLRGANMEQAGRLLIDEINLARQIASAQNENIELRILLKSSETDPEPEFRALQSGKTDPDGNFSPVTRLSELPDGIIVSPTPQLSSLVTSRISDYLSITIRPNGMVELTNANTLNPPWFITTVHKRDRDKSPGELHDFVCVEIDPWTGRAMTYRP